MHSSGSEFARPCVLIVAVLASSYTPCTIGETPSIDEIVVTAAREPVPAFDLPASVHVVDGGQIVDRQYRTLPQALRDVPGVMVQETAFGQGSPYLRGFTGFRTLFLVDGIRLNNSVYREGPNQYGSTVDLFAVDRLEVVHGPASTLYGSDAIGGAVNALSPDPARATPRVLVRMSSAEESVLGRVEFAINPGEATSLAGGMTGRTSDDLHGGRTVGRQQGVGYDEHGVDVKATHRMAGDWSLDAALQTVDQNDVPRTHTTLDGVSWEGTSVGSDRSRRLDQERVLSYARLQNSNLPGPVKGVSLTAAYAQTEEVQRRVRGSGASDRQGFEVDTFGLLAQFHSDTPIGALTYGIDFYGDAVDSFSSSNPVQGPVADDADYDMVDFYVQDRIAWHQRSTLALGLRRTSVDVRARRVLDPLRGEPYRIDESWSATVGSVGANWAFAPDRFVMFANVSEGFRAPNLSDLSRFDSARSNEIEVPVRGLDEERFLSREVGLKFRASQANLQLAYFNTDIEDQIQRVPTGRLLDGQYEITKANVGDGEVEGIELSWRGQLGPRVDVFGHAAWLAGDVETYPTSLPVLASEPLDRLMPVNGALGVRWRPGGAGLWFEGQVVSFGEQDDLSTADSRDTSRIPPGGTPGFTVLHLRAGVPVSQSLDVTFGVDNVTDVDYRIHGSGTNMPGRNFIVTLGAQL